MRKQTGTGGRQVLDKNYFVNELRQKRLDIANVTQRMRVRLLRVLSLHIICSLSMRICVFPEV